MNATLPPTVVERVELVDLAPGVVVGGAHLEPVALHEVLRRAKIHETSDDRVGVAPEVIRIVVVRVGRVEGLPDHGDEGLLVDDDVVVVDGRARRLSRRRT